MDQERVIILMKAAVELLDEHKDSIPTLVYYDEADSDVYCLIEDIKIELNAD